MREVLIGIRIRFPNPESSTIHRIRNFGEDVWRAFRHNNRVHIDLGTVDRAVDEISLTVRDTFVSKALPEIRKILKSNLMESEAQVELFDLPAARGA